jgi:hypothetical protein
VLTQYRKRNRENITGYPPSCGEPLGEGSYGFQVTEFEHRAPLTNPDMERTEKKKSVI